MAYTVKKMNELSGVSVRTLHFYEEIGLLKPAYYGNNGYRYYEEKELLHLQQILFFKELGFTLKQIQKVLGRSDFDQLRALHSHKEALSKEWEKIGQLLKTIDKTIKHLKGQKKMKDDELFSGFSLVKPGTGKEPYFLAESVVLNNLKPCTIAKEELIQQSHALFKELVQCVKNGLAPSTKEVQSIIKRHHTYAEQCHNATKEVYKSLAELYRQHPAFKKQLDPFHKDLAEFMAKAMEAFANRELT